MKIKNLKFYINKINMMNKKKFNKKILKMNKKTLIFISIQSKNHLNQI